MTSLQDLLPPRGSSNWHRTKSYSVTNEGNDVRVRHAVVREVWLEKRPSPHAVYKIEVMSKSAHWFVFRRYREFYQFHQKLIKKYGIPKDLLPPRKFTNRLSLETLEARREALEHYLQRVINSYDRGVSTCEELVEFLEVKTHDVSHVTQTLAVYLKEKGEKILATDDIFSLSPVELHCIKKQLYLAHPSEGAKVDLGYLYDFVKQLRRLCITDLISRASHGRQFESNFTCDVSLFSSLTELQIDGCKVSSLDGISSLPGKLTKLTARYCLHTMKEFLMESAVETRSAPKVKATSERWRAQAAQRLSDKRVVVQPWVCLSFINFSQNNISCIDNSISWLPALRELDLSYNKISHLDLGLLTESPLQRLSLVANDICLISGSTKTLDELKYLNLRQNRIESMEGLLCAQGLKELDLANNSIIMIAEVWKLAALANLVKLSVKGNPFARQRRHRMLVFAYFRERELYLDNRPLSRKEKLKLDARFNSTNSDAQLDDSMSISTVSDDDMDSGIEGHVPSSRLTPLIEEEDWEIIDNTIDLERYSLASNTDQEDEDWTENMSREDWDQVLYNQRNKHGISRVNFTDSSVSKIQSDQLDTVNIRPNETLTSVQVSSPVCLCASANLVDDPSVKPKSVSGSAVQKIGNSVSEVNDRPVKWTDRTPQSNSSFPSEANSVSIISIPSNERTSETGISSVGQVNDQSSNSSAEVNDQPVKRTNRMFQSNSNSSDETSHRCVMSGLSNETSSETDIKPVTQVNDQSVKLRSTTAANRTFQNSGTPFAQDTGTLYLHSDHSDASLSGQSDRDVSDTDHSSSNLPFSWDYFKEDPSSTSRKKLARTCSEPISKKDVYVLPAVEEITANVASSSPASASHCEKGMECAEAEEETGSVNDLDDAHQVHEEQNERYTSDYRHNRTVMTNSNVMRSSTFS